MNVREKLAELIKDGIRKGLRAKGDDRLDYSFEDVADHLIANGVTVQEWISVDERMPEPKENAIYINRRGDMMIGTYTEWDWMFPCYFEKPTHWMPIPHPPKGE